MSPAWDNAVNLPAALCVACQEPAIADRKLLPALGVSSLMVHSLPLTSRF